MVNKETLDELREVPFEKWKARGVKLRAVSANAGGVVNSGVLQDGRYFLRQWSNGFKSSSFVFEKGAQ